MNDVSPFKYAFEHYVNGRFIPSANAIDVLNPSTGRPIGAVPDADQQTVAEAVAAARTAQAAWGRKPANERAVVLRAIATKIRENLPHLAQITAVEQGKVLPLAQMEIFITAEYLDYMAEWGRRIEGEVITSDRAGENIFMFRRPMGVVAGILPWNFPFFMIARKLAPALITGNAIIIKPSEETPFGAAAFAKIVSGVDIPAGVVNFVCGRGATTGEALVRDSQIDMVSFTGSSNAGAQIMASAARNITKVNLELGGKAPAIVLDDANIELAIGCLKVAKSLNTGQACNSAERVYVQKGIAAEFTDKLAKAVGSIRSGDPFGGAEVDMGPLINRAAVERIGALVEDARGKGAKVLVGGAAESAREGFHYRPTVLTNVKPDMAIMKREIFGPVLLVETVENLDEGIARANDSEYGLTSSIFTTNISSAMKAIAELRYGETYVNRENFEAIQGFHAGVRRSGIGGADGKHGLYEYTHTQVAYIQS